MLVSHRTPISPINVQRHALNVHLMYCLAKNRSVLLFGYFEEKMLTTLCLKKTPVVRPLSDPGFVAGSRLLIDGSVDRFSAG